MNISLDKPELENFVNAQIQAGRYPTAKDLVEAAVARLMLDPIDEELTPEDIAAIEESEAQFARGEGLDWEDVKKELRAKYLK